MNFSLLQILFISCFFAQCNQSKKEVITPVDKATIVKKEPKSTSKEEKKLTAPAPSIGYDLSSYDQIINLPLELKEISGLTYWAKEDKLLAVNDEHADIYVLDSKTGEVTAKLDFGKKGDYEGIEVVGDTVYVVKSNGNIHPFNLDTKSKMEVFKTELSSMNDVEGLGYDYTNNQLLLACKGSPSTIDKPIDKAFKSVYQFDLQSSKLLEVPFLTVSDSALIAKVEKQLEHEELSKSKRKKFIQRAKNFSPSAIAKHPTTGQFYMLSSVGKLLVILDKNKNIESVHFLDSQFHTQPEGLCFDNENNLFISNEAKGFIAKIFKYKLL